MADVLESFVSIKADCADIWPFLTQRNKVAMWLLPLVDLDVGVADLSSRAVFEFKVLGKRVLDCQMLSMENNTLQIHFDGLASGHSTWRVVPAGEKVIVQNCIEYELDRRLLVPWGVLGRWLAIGVRDFQMRRLKARVEDTVGNSSFGLPVLVSPYAIAIAAVGGAILLTLGIDKVRKYFQRGRYE